MLIFFLHYFPEYFYFYSSNIFSTKSQYRNVRSENCLIFTCGFFFVANIVFVLLLLVLIS